MVETLTVFTVKDQWTVNSSVKDDTIFDTIVGTITPRGRELWVPQKRDDYRYRSGGYSNGYSLKDVTETSITLPDDMSVRFTDFFKKMLLKRNWADKGISKEKYDCHWFAQWLDGQIKPRTSILRTVLNADKVIGQGSLIERPLTMGEVGVLGYESTGFPYGQINVAEHSLVGLDDTNALQVMGKHGAVAIAPQRETAQHYAEISDSLLHQNSRNFGMYVSLAEAPAQTPSQPEVQLAA